ncbi:YsnF/AvaK domain-containing protein [Mucilaginibacter robiniae]|uniref:YsnF/AvaK domain-containing protein n=1 Tax=Mucilaginibacter robiniae TaxID=2728022 RepID=A0A7L5E4N6_9SPHI|nr:YsnF/AvaK domain-containing protein [Mucilaginibacter robiniae]
MVLDTDANDFSLEARKVLVPIGIAELDEDDDDVILPNVTAEQIAALPLYTKDSLNADTESRIRDIFAGLGAAGVAAGAYGATHNAEFYNHEQFDQNRLYNRRLPAHDATTDAQSIPVIEENLEVGKREVETGGVRVTSNIVERPVEETINLKEEHVRVERTPVDRPVVGSDLDTFKEGEIELTEHAEVPVVSKEARVVEEVRVNKDVEEKEETIRDTVRNTEVETERFDDTNKKDLL